MNHHDRRARAAPHVQRKRRAHDHLYRDYIRYLPRHPPGAPLDPARIYHRVVFHDGWCRYFTTGRVTDCDCAPVEHFHFEPMRS